MTGRRWTSGFALFGEVLITGVLVAVLSLPVVTALPAVAAGTAHLRRHLTGDSVRVADLMRDFGAACRGLWRLALGLTGVALVLLWNLSLGQAGVMPGAGGVVTVSALLLVAWAVLLLRTAAGWRAGASGGAELLRATAERAWRDPAGSVLLAFACGMCGLFVWMLLPLVLVAGGLLCLASLAVELRHEARTTPGPDAAGGVVES
ncbi:hypothetical protein [Streptomyces sp. B6B3]|uniref:hypothetical protein n=1 Tax=Streptomyces sp. B6B3 TaxID=3153570 RepID=UPI00325F44FB